MAVSTGSDTLVIYGRGSGDLYQVLVNGQQIVREDRGSPFGHWLGHDVDWRDGQAEPDGFFPFIVMYRGWHPDTRLRLSLGSFKLTTILFKLVQTAASDT